MQIIEVTAPARPLPSAAPLMAAARVDPPPLVGAAPGLTTYVVAAPGGHPPLSAAA